ncbi:MAG: histidine kinase dimerization/phospho-acceptor domain-containing protein [Gemmataceae bacterium]
MARKDGSRWWGLFAPTRLSGSGRDLECVEFIVDVTKANEAEQALREADRREDEFIAILAHVLRNPLAPIGNGLQVIRLSDDREVRLGAQGMMERQLTHMVRLIDDLLDVSRLSRNKMRLCRSRVTLAEAVYSAV